MSEPSTVTASLAVHLTGSLEEFQSEEQRQVLDTVAHLRKCGLETVLPLPQIAVCGNQSAGKSSVLEALTEIPFPRNDNLCTRFATEITLRRGLVDSLNLSIIPDNNRPKNEKQLIAAFSETISDFAELPAVMSRAAAAMGIGSGPGDSVDGPPKQAFARDVLSFHIEGPDRPQLTVVDVPGLIQTETKGVTRMDREMVAEITDFYIKQERTICLAVIQATDDYANQPILTKVREVDPEGNRTLGVITKPDRLDHGSGSEAAYLALARNEDVFFSLGWHVVKNRKFEESSYSIVERNASEAEFFRKSNFKQLPAECCGIDALRTRLSGLLFDHIKRELPTLRQELESALTFTTMELGTLGSQRVTALECRNYLTSISLKCLELTKAAMNGHYEGDYFQNHTDDDFNVAIKRFCAVVQHVNKGFTNTMRRRGAKFYISMPTSPDDIPVTNKRRAMKLLLYDDALAWVARVLERTRGKEPIGNYNPLIIGELFWELSSQWKQLAEDHIHDVSRICSIFSDTLLKELCPKDVQIRLSALKITDALKTREAQASEELHHLLRDKQEFPLDYNHYYTDNVQKFRHARMKRSLGEAIDAETTHRKLPGCHSDHASVQIDVNAAVQRCYSKTEPDMEKYSCEEALDCVLSMYKSQQKTFVANVTTQVIGRHMVRGLDTIFTPLDVNALSDEEVLNVASEPRSERRKREQLVDRQQKLLNGQKIFREIMGRSV